MKKSERLMKRLEDELHLDIPVGSRFRRLYPGHAQRANGAWSWCIERHPQYDIGSNFSVTELLKCKTLVAYEDHRTVGASPEIMPGKEVDDGADM